jgi:hypothetical protein
LQRPEFERRIASRLRRCGRGEQFLRLGVPPAFDQAARANGDRAWIGRGGEDLLDFLVPAPVERLERAIGWSCRLGGGALRLGGRHQRGRDQQDRTDDEGPSNLQQFRHSPASLRKPRLTWWHSMASV